LPESHERSPLWAGTLSFGLVTIPVELHPAIRSSAGVSFRMLAPDGMPLQREYLCPEHERSVTRDEIVRGYELEDGSFVTITDEELDALAPDASRDIELERFVEPAELSPLWFERAYFLLPNTGVTKPYGLLAQVLEETGRVGIARFVLRGRQHLVAIFGEGGLLRAQTMRFVEQLRSADVIGLTDASVEVDEAQVEQLRAYIREHSAASLDADQLVDDRAARILARAQEKLEAGEDVVEIEADERSEAAGSEIIDLADVLARSLARPGARTGPAMQPPADAPPSLGPDASKEQLYELAQALEIEGRGRMSKAELAEAIERARSRT
jgi:DNA end-binding protein Ku